MVQVVTGDSQEEVMIFRDTQTNRHCIIIYISPYLSFATVCVLPFGKRRRKCTSIYVSRGLSRLGIVTLIINMMKIIIMVTIFIIFFSTGYRLVRSQLTSLWMPRSKWVGEPDIYNI